MDAERLEFGVGQDKSEDGLVFSLIMLGFPFFMEAIFLGAIYGGSLNVLLGGLVLVFIMLLFGVGFFNSHLARYFWDLKPKRTLTSWLGQGILVLLMLPLFGYVYYMIIVLLWGFASPPAILSAAVLFFLDAIASGYIGRHVAAEFEEQREGVEELASVADRHILCPHCGSLFMCRSSMIGPNGNATCPHCRRAVVVPVEGPRPEYSDWERKPKRSDW
jgi:hypothetical protein